MHWSLMFALGFYVCGALFTFVFVGFFVLLGGKGEALWLPFACAAFWPIMLPLFIAGYLG